MLCIADPSAIKKIASHHKIVVLEGFWGAGKSTVAHYLRNATGGIIVPEPSVPRRRNMRSAAIAAWFVAAHERGRQKIGHIVKRNRRLVIGERSILSSAAFEYASKGYVSEIMRRRIRNFFSRQSIAVVYLKPTSALVARGIARLHDASVLRQLRRTPNFIAAYHEFFCTVLPHDFKVQNLYCLHTSARLLSSLRKRVREVSAAGVVIHGRKVVVLYDRKCRHLVLPQGHGKAGESLMQTACREITEEAGFIDLAYGKKLHVYQYHFPRVSEMVYKTIHVYLFYLRTMKRKPQVLEDHEWYGVRLIPPHLAAVKLRWPQDRLVVRLAMREIKKRARREN